jgi:3-dehydrosphinganine reductase
MTIYKDKKVYVVGGSSGIGLEVAKQFAENGANVIIFARNLHRLELAQSEISGCRATDHQRVKAKGLDVTDPTQVTRVMNLAISEFGVPDFLINVAGGVEPRYFQDITYEQFDRIMKVNLYGTWNTISVLFPFMKETGGYIVNTSSIAGIIGVFGYSDYSASKFALIGLSESLRSEFKPYSINVSVLCPPDTDTPMLEAENKIKPKETKALSAGAKVLSADQVARALLKGINRKKFIIIPGSGGNIIHFFKRLFPSILAGFMDNTVKKVQASQGDNI